MFVLKVRVHGNVSLEPLLAGRTNERERFHSLLLVLDGLNLERVFGSVLPGLLPQLVEQGRVESGVGV